MIIVVAILAFTTGLISGFKYASWCNGRVFQSLIDQGIVVVRTEDGWEGLPSAMMDIALKFKDVQDESEQVGR